MSQKTIFKNLIKLINDSADTSFSGYSGALGSLLLASKASEKKVTLFVTVTEQRAKELAEEAGVWFAGSDKPVVCMLPGRDSVYDQIATQEEVLSDRLRALSMSVSGGGLVIAPVATLLERFCGIEDWKRKSFVISTESEISRQELINKLVDLGYERKTLVEEPKTFAVRGGLVDLFPVNMGVPARLDFFGDDLESIKLFSIHNQRSFQKVDSILLTPGNEFTITESDIQEIKTKVSAEIGDSSDVLSSLLARKLEYFLSKPGSREYNELKPFVSKSNGFLTDFWDNLELIIEEGEEVFVELKNLYDEIEQKHSRLVQITPLKTPDYYYFSPEVVHSKLQQRGCVHFSRFGKSSNPIFADIEFFPPPTDLSRESLLNDLKLLLKYQWAIVIVIKDRYRLENLKGLLAERKIKIHNSIDPLDFRYGSVLFVEGPLRRGFKNHSQKLAIYTQEDIFAFSTYENKPLKRPSRKKITELAQMVPGDIVVHADHGIAEFRGIKTLTAASHTREYLLLQYAGSDKLYVPTDQLNKVTKYMGTEGFIPKIHGLNSKIWLTQKKRVSSSVELIAKELVELYAKRLAGEGFTFSPDTELQYKMESLFPYVETVDQMSAIEAVKKDMESTAPMDRLICGDVGYGKTEVALRAVFKAVCSGKQVAILAPTTLLVLQHHQTIQERFKDFPIKIDSVSRLKKPAEQREIIKRAKTGALDVLIGTHRLLSNDVNFNNLGLLVVDEEQRFGVKHKEKLKQLKTQIDVLTLTATPIPRTMQMALSGIRQISIIDTPPPDRKPVQTYVAPMDATWVKRAIIEELKRGGQIYYVYNRVEKIEQKAQLLQKLVPEARIVVAHGQQPEQKVENTMLDFVGKKFDILMATTIIESGLDIPNVNTLIVDEAERLGLAQMYQLRGRVGRSSRQAWAYFFYSRHKLLTQEAKERLETIEEHTALGSGFRIALRDMQIRGAGSILGESQSGQIASVGLSLYLELLEEAVEKYKTNSTLPFKPEVAIEIPVTAYFPVSYIPEEETRVEIYSRLARCSDLALLKLIKEECVDRFGFLPEGSKGLFEITALRIAASQKGIIKVTKLINKIRFEFASDYMPDLEKIQNINKQKIFDIFVDPSDPTSINLKLIDLSVNNIFNEVQELLKMI